MVKSTAIFLMISLFFLGCAADRPVRKEEQTGAARTESARRDETLEERLRAIEASVSSLRAEQERGRAMEKTVSALRSDVEALADRLRRFQARPPLAAYQLPREVFLAGERVPLENRTVWENLDREFLLALDNQAQVLLWMKRARRYFPYIEKRLREMDLPDDLKYVTITESSLRPSAVSSSGAAGIWQFIPSTGGNYGMRKNRGVDERFDFFKATEGALAYLRSLYLEFGSWPLAMAAYNAGENRVRREIEFQKTKDYFFLDLPTETERYVYKIAAAKIILSDPGSFGFRLGEREFYDPLQVERIQIELSQPLPIVSVARALGFFYKEIKEMNPHLSEDAIPVGVHYLNLPPGTSERFWVFFSGWKKEQEGTR